MNREGFSMHAFKHMIYLLCLAVLAACAGAPTQQMADARMELKAAEEAGAKENAQESLLRARKTLSIAEQQLELGNYYDARVAADKSRDEATNARLVALAITSAKEVIARAQKINADLTTAREALQAAQQAAQLNKMDRALSEAIRAEELAIKEERNAKAKNE